MPTLTGSDTDFAFGQDQRLRQSAKEKPLPKDAHRDRGHTISYEELDEAAQLGSFGLRVSEKFGGQEAAMSPAA